MEGWPWRWQETDPHGLVIWCAEEVWARKARQHPEIVANEEAIRAALRNPEAIYYDPDATAKLQGSGAGVVMRYVGPGTVQSGQWRIPMSVAIAVKVLPTTGGEVVGYVRTMFLTARLQSRLQLRWSRRGWRPPDE